MPQTSVTREEEKQTAFVALPLCAPLPAGWHETRSIQSRLAL